MFLVLPRHCYGLLDQHGSGGILLVRARRDGAPTEKAGESGEQNPG